MKFSLKIFSVFGIPVELHISFLLLMLIIYTVAFLGVIPIHIAVLITLVFVTVVIHELSHSYVAQKYGVTIERIILLPIGGVSAMEEIPKDPGQELKIAFAGPIINFIIAFACFIILLITGNTEFLTFSSLFILNPSPPNLALFISNFLAINLILGIFNLLPAFPMDGGRILRAYLARKMSYVNATKTAATIGKQFAIIMAIAGIFINLFLIIIALFVYIGAEQEYRAVLISSLLEGVYVKDIMTKHVDTLSPDTTISEALYTMFRQKHMGYPIIEGENLVGIITFDDISKIPEDKRNMSVGGIMTRELILTNPDEPAINTLEKITKHDIGRLPVTENGKLVGIISKTDIMRILEMLYARSAE